jgi:hypothetical protein
MYDSNKNRGNNMKDTLAIKQLYAKYTTQHRHLRQIIQALSTYFRHENNTVFFNTEAKKKFNDQHKKQVDASAIGLLQLIHPQLTNYFTTKAEIMRLNDHTDNKNDSLSYDKTEKEKKEIEKQTREIQRKTCNNIIKQSLAKLGRKVKETDFARLFGAHLPKDSNRTETQLEERAQYYLNSYK